MPGWGDGGGKGWGWGTVVCIDVGLHPASLKKIVVVVDCNMIQLDVLFLGLLCSVQLVFCISSHAERSSLFKHSSQAVSVNTCLTLCVCHSAGLIDKHMNEQRKQKQSMNNHTQKPTTTTTTTTTNEKRKRTGK